jgi:hypothetical protein
MTQTPTLHLPARHRWPIETERRLAHTEFPDGNGRTERTCPLCGLVRVTVHGANGQAWREFRLRDSPNAIRLSTTPPCGGQKQGDATDEKI